MSANDTRRHESPWTTMATGKRLAERIWTLIRLRDYLARAAAAHDAHGLDGTVNLLTEQWSIETAIRELAPTVYDDNWTMWLQYDGQLAHTPEQPSEHCHICAMNTAV